MDSTKACSLVSFYHLAGWFRCIYMKDLKCCTNMLNCHKRSFNRRHLFVALFQKSSECCSLTQSQQYELEFSRTNILIIETMPNITVGLRYSKKCWSNKDLKDSIKDFRLTWSEEFLKKEYIFTHMKYLKNLY